MDIDIISELKQKNTENYEDLIVQIGTDFWEKSVCSSKSRSADLADGAAFDGWCFAVGRSCLVLANALFGLFDLDFVPWCQISLQKYPLYQTALARSQRQRAFLALCWGGFAEFALVLLDRMEFGLL